MSRVKRIVLWTVTGLLAFAVGLSVAVSLPAVQSQLVEWSAANLAASTGLDVEIEGVRIGWFDRELQAIGIDVLMTKGSAELLPLRIEQLGVSGFHWSQGQLKLESVSIEGVHLDLETWGKFTSVSPPSNGSGSDKAQTWSLGSLSVRDIHVRAMGHATALDWIEVNGLSDRKDQPFIRAEAKWSNNAVFPGGHLWCARNDTGIYKLDWTLGQHSGGAAWAEWDGDLKAWGLDSAHCATSDFEGVFDRVFSDRLQVQAAVEALGDFTLNARGEVRSNTRGGAEFHLAGSGSEFHGRLAEDFSSLELNRWSMNWDAAKRLGRAAAPEFWDKVSDFRPTNMLDPTFSGTLHLAGSDSLQTAQGQAFQIVRAELLAEGTKNGNARAEGVWAEDTLTWKIESCDWEISTQQHRIISWTGKAYSIESQDNWEGFGDLYTTLGEHHGGMEISLGDEGHWTAGLFGRADRLVLPHDLSGSCSVWAQISAAPDRPMAIEAVMSQGRMMHPKGREHRVDFVHLQGTYIPHAALYPLELKIHSDVGTLHYEGTGKLEKSMRLGLELERPEPVAALIHPSLAIKPGMKLEFNEKAGSISAAIPGWGWKGWTAHGLQLEGEIGQPSKATSGGVRLRVSLDHVMRGDEQWARDIALQCSPLEGTPENITFDLGWKGQTQSRIRGRHAILSEGHAVNFEQFDFSFGPAQWSLSSETPAITEQQESQSWLFTGLDWTGDHGDISISGSLGREADQQIQVNATGLSVERWGQTIEDFNLKRLSGEITGQLTAQAVLSSPTMRYNVDWSEAAYRGTSLGRVSAIGFSDSAGRHRGTCSSFDTRENLRFTWDLMPNADEDKSVALLQMWNWPVRTLNPMIAPDEIQFEGSLTGTVRVTDPVSNPALHGSLNIDELQVSVTQSGTSFGVEGEVILAGDLIAMDAAKITDAQGHQGVANLTVFHENWREFTYDVGIDIEEEPFLCLDLEPGVNEFFYGQVVASGMVDVSGSLGRVQIEAQARSHEGTVFSLPLDGFDDPTLPDHFHFTSAQNEVGPVNEAPFNIDLTLDIEALSGTEVEIIFDAEAGDYMVGTGTGQLSLVMSQNEEFGMRGAITLDDGAYGFSLRDLVHKDIELIPGGTLVWSGDPYEAEVALETAYRVDAALTPLLGPGPDHGRTPVEVRMRITGAMSRPDIAFELLFPRASAATRAEANAVLSHEGETTRQAFALLVAGQFISLDIGEFNAQNALIGNATELLSARISSMLSQLSDEVDIGLRYTPSGENTSGREEDELAVAMATRILNDRLKIKGSLGARGVLAAPQSPSNFLGSVELEYQLTEDGRWILDAYSAPSGADLFQEGQRHGIGISHRVAAERFRDLFRWRDN